MVRVVDFREQLLESMPRDGGGEAELRVRQTLQFVANFDFGPGNAAARGIEVLIASMFDRTTAPQQARAADRALLPFLIEVLFVLCTLLGGVQREEAQRRMIEAGAATTLSALFDVMGWDSDDKDRTGCPPLHGAPRLGGNRVAGAAHMRVRRSWLHLQPPRNNEGPPRCPRAASARCEADCVPRLQVQFLRLVRNLCEASTTSYAAKRAMLSAAELAELAEIADELGDPAQRDFDAGWLKAAHFSPGDTGLLSKIIATLRSTPNAYEQKVFLASAVEGYLRGAPEADRLFVLRRGLLESVLAQLLGTESVSSSTVQSLLDLLAEMVKFSRRAMGMVACVLAKQHGGELGGPRALRAACMSQLVESNVFMRAVLLTLEPPDPLWCRLVGAPGELVMALLASIDLDELNQENICCLNTMLVGLIAAQRRGALQEELEAVRKGQSEAQLRRLLLFWRHYYCREHRERDVATLEKGSRVDFSEWCSLVDAVLAMIQS